MILRAIAILLVMGVAVSACAQEALNQHLFADLGVPVQRNALYNHVLGTDGEGRERYYQAYKGEPWFLLSIDPLTGEAEQYTTEMTGNPYGICWASNRQLYVSTGGSGVGEIYRFDPASKQLTLVARTPEPEAVVWQLCEAEDGKLYGGTYPNARLLRLDLRTQELTDLGRIDPEQKYIRTLDTAGEYVYCNTGPSHAGVWAYHIPTGAREQILPERLRTQLSWGTAQKRADGKVYITAGDETFRVDGTGLAPAEELPPARLMNYQGSPTKMALTMRDGTVITVDSQSGVEQRYYIQQPAQERQTVKLSYEGTSTRLWALQEGPDGMVYGTTRGPITLFRVEPQTDEVTILGDPVHVNGQVYGMVWHRGRLCMAAYGKSRVVVWDPEQPWNWGVDPESNPRLIGSCHIGRPAALVVAPDGRHLLAGGVPGYGRTGGVLTIIEPDEAQIETIPDLFGTQSVASMVTLPEHSLVCIGTTYRGGSASEAPRTAPRLLLWDFDTREIVFETVPVPGEDAIVQMVRIGDRVFGTTEGDGHLFVFDLARRTLAHSAPLGYGPGCLFGLRYRAADGMLYAVCGDSIVRIDPSDYSIERLGSHPDLAYGMGMAGEHIYLCAGTHLLRFTIPPCPDAGP
jgi:hypothetical protein